MAKILCIPDIHARKFWRQTVADNIDKVDKVIFDYLRAIHQLLSYPYF